MPNPQILMLGAKIGGGLFAANSAKKAASSASAAQIAGTQMQIAEQRRQFNLMRKLTAPYVTAGGKGLAGLMNLTGMNGVGSQKNAISGIENGAQYGEMVRSGENAILSNASATGGLRGGNTEAALAQFRPQILSSLIDKQIGNLTGLTQMGQNSASGVGTAAMTMGNNISTAYGDAAAARAGNYMAAGKANASMISGITGGIGELLGGIEPPVGASMFSKWGF